MLSHGGEVSFSKQKTTGEIEVYDDFLNLEEFAKVQRFMMGDEMPWYYNSTKARSDETLLENELYNFQFVHNFYNQFGQSSQLMHHLQPIVNKIDPFMLVRVKANMNPVTDKRVTFGFHNDFEVVTLPLKTAVFYVNSNNGATVFDSGQEIESKANRLVVFDSKLVHAGTSCTDEKVRCVINLNFVNA